MIPRDPDITRSNASRACDTLSSCCGRKVGDRATPPQNGRPTDHCFAEG